MRLKSVKLKNFRCYRNEIEAHLNNLSVFIGKNDAGKSSILEALEIFSEGFSAPLFLSLLPCHPPLYRIGMACMEVLSNAQEKRGHQRTASPPAFRNREQTASRGKNLTYG